MAPALRPGDLLLAARNGSIGRGALVVVEHPERPGFELVKRVAALPGELAEGSLLGPDEYWVTGDNRDASTDSRSIGPVRRSQIHGVVLFRYWPLRRGPCGSGRSLWAGARGGRRAGGG
jgi:signal peptidase I